MVSFTQRYKDTQRDVLDSAHKVFLASVGAVSSIEQESNKLFDELVAKGRTFEKERREQLDRTRGEVENNVEELSSKVTKRIERTVDEALERIGVPTRNEIQTLAERVRNLITQVEALDATMRASQGDAKPETGTVAKKTAAKKTTTKAERVTVFVTPHEEGWKVILDGADEPLSVHATKDAATTAARAAAHERVPSLLVIHRLDGTIQTQSTYDAES
ncbi:MAG: phasin family protein [Acidobacteriota bacterium]